MSIHGIAATKLLEANHDRVALFRKDNTDKFWSYKVKGGSHSEFAFDPKTTRKLIVRFDQQPPALPGVTDIERIEGENVSTALGRVFSGGLHTARYKATIADGDTLLAVIAVL